MRRLFERLIGGGSMLDFPFLWNTIIILIPYFADALRILFFSILFGALLGALVAKQKLGKNKIARRLGIGYTTFIRCVPGIVLLYVIYYGLLQILGAFGIDANTWDKSVFIIIAFALFCGASLSEVFRSAYQSIGSGQREAGISIGLTEVQAFRRIVFPQMFRVILPPFGNTVVAVLNESSLGFAIGYMDILGRAKLVGNKSYGVKNVEIYLAAGVLYWIASILVGRVIALLERRFEAVSG
jgi:L-cystine transport system permease protein